MSPSTNAIAKSFIPLPLQGEPAEFVEHLVPVPLQRIAVVMNFALLMLHKGINHPPHLHITRHRLVSFVARSKDEVIMPELVRTVLFADVPVPKGIVPFPAV